MNELIWHQSESIRQLEKCFHTFLGDHGGNVISLVRSGPFGVLLPITVSCTLSPLLLMSIYFIGNNEQFKPREWANELYDDWCISGGFRCDLWWVV